MKKFIEFFFGYGSSFVYIIVAYWILWYQPTFDGGLIPLRVTFITLIFFMFSQAALVQLMKGQEESQGMKDFVLSAFTLFALGFLPFASKIEGLIIWWDIYIIFCFGGLYDFLINNRMILRMFRMSTGFAKED